MKGSKILVRRLLKGTQKQTSNFSFSKDLSSFLKSKTRSVPPCPAHQHVGEIPCFGSEYQTGAGGSSAPGLALSSGLKPELSHCLPQTGLAHFTLEGSHKPGQHGQKWERMGETHMCSTGEAHWKLSSLLLSCLTFCFGSRPSSSELLPLIPSQPGPLLLLLLIAPELEQNCSRR